MNYTIAIIGNCDRSHYVIAISLSTIHKVYEALHIMCVHWYETLIQPKEIETMNFDPYHPNMVERKLSNIELFKLKRYTDIGVEVKNFRNRRARVARWDAFKGGKEIASAPTMQKLVEKLERIYNVI